MSPQSLHRPKRGNRRKASRSPGRQSFLPLQGGGYFMVFLPVRSTLQWAEVSSPTPIGDAIWTPPAPHPNKIFKKGSGGGEGGWTCDPLATHLALQPLPFLPVYPFPDTSIPPFCPQKFDDRKGNRKKFSCPNPGGRSTSLFKANPRFPWRHPEPGPMGARSAAAAAERRWEGVPADPPPRRPEASRGGGKGPSTYKPWFSGLGRSRRLRCTGKGDP